MKLSVKEMTVFGLLGAIMYASKKLMEIIPNVHLIGAFVMAVTLVFRQKALFPIYLYVLLSGLFDGFTAWWIPQLYVWTVLWGITMLLPKKIPPKLRPFVYAFVCSLHGLLYGTLYAPVHALLFGLGIKGMIAWISAGIPWDIVHAIGNFVFGALIVPIVSALKRSQ